MTTPYKPSDLPLRRGDIRPYHRAPPSHPFGPCTEVANVAIDDDNMHVIASPEPHVQYGLEIHGGEGLRLSTDGRILPGDPVFQATTEPIWFTVARPAALLVAQKEIKGTANASVRLLRRGR